MHTTDFITGWDTAVLMVPFFGLLGFWMFGLDVLMAAPKSRPAPRRFCQAEWDGRPILTDPDGKPWPRNRQPATMTITVRRPVENRLCARIPRPSDTTSTVT